MKLIKFSITTILIIGSFSTNGQGCDVIGLSSTPYADATKDNIIAVDLSWSVNASAEKYQAQIYFDGAISVSDSTTSTMVTMEYLSPDAGYIWRVRAKCSGMWDTWPSWQSSFTTPSGAVCEVTGHSASTSVDASKGNVISAELSWSSNSIAEEYQVQILYDENISVSETTTGTDVTMENLFPNVNYLWRVRVKCNGEWNDWPDWQSDFNTPNGEVCEASGHSVSTNYDITSKAISAELSWSVNTIAEEYQVQIAHDETTSVSLITTTTNVVMTDLSQDANYIWRVRVKCNDEWSPWPSWQSNFDTPAIPNAWVNEVHYDNTGSDVGEFIEIVIENAADYTPLTDFTVTLYNGGDGTAYSSFNIDTSDPMMDSSTVGDFSFYAYTFPPNGIQNGSPNGISLDYKGTAIQFLSYEGTFTATDGVAQGIESSDIMVSESETTTAGTSLQLCCDGFVYEDMIWQSSAPETKGSSNNSQVLPVELGFFHGNAKDGEVILNWQTYSELNNDYFIVEKSKDGSEFQVLGTQNGNGTSNRPNTYSLIDRSPYTITYYRLTQVDFDGSKTIYEIIRVASELNVDFTVYPNPASDKITIQSSNLLTDKFTLQILDISGKAILRKEVQLTSGSYTMDLTPLKPGVYTVYLLSRFNRFNARFSVY